MAELKRKLDGEKEDPKNAVKNSIGVNEGGFTRFKHKPSNLIVTFRDTKKIIGSINWEGQRWDWGHDVSNTEPRDPKGRENQSNILNQTGAFGRPYRRIK